MPRKTNKCLNAEHLAAVRRRNGERNWVAGRLCNAVTTLRRISGDLDLPPLLASDARKAAELAELVLKDYKAFIENNPATAANTPPPPIPRREAK